MKKFVRITKIEEEEVDFTDLNKGDLFRIVTDSNDDGSWRKESTIYRANSDPLPNRTCAEPSVNCTMVGGLPKLKCPDCGGNLCIRGRCLSA